MIINVSNVNGTFGNKNSGSVAEIVPMSLMFFVSSPSVTAKIVMTTMATSGAGMTLLMRGNKKMMASEPATSAKMIQLSPSKFVSCAWKIKIAKALTKPTMTARGMNFINRAMPK